MGENKTLGDPAQEAEVSVIVPFHNHHALLARLLATIRQCTSPSVRLELIVVDDASRESPEPLCAEYDARLHRLTENRGPAHARNVGAQLATAPVLFFFDADVECPPGLIEAALDVLRAQPEVHGVSFLNQIYRKGDAAVANYNALFEHWSFARLFEPSMRTLRCSGFSTRNGAVRRAAFEAIGGFDTRYRTNAHEDYDFGKRLSGQFACVLVREPNPYHNYPTRLRRLLRNYWVRITLFVPYFLEKRPPLDRGQISKPEMSYRILGAGALLLAVLAATLPGARGAAVLAVVAAAGYLYGVSELLATSYKVSKSPLFVVQCLGLHYLSTLTIAVGGALALARAVWSRTVNQLTRQGSE